MHDGETGDIEDGKRETDRRQFIFTEATRENDAHNCHRRHQHTRNRLRGMKKLRVKLTQA